MFTRKKLLGKRVIKMKNDLFIVIKGSKKKVSKAMEEIECEVKELTGKGYAVREIKSVPEPKKQIAKGGKRDGASI